MQFLNQISTHWTEIDLAQAVVTISPGPIVTLGGALSSSRSSVGRRETNQPLFGLDDCLRRKNRIVDMGQPRAVSRCVRGLED
jgi:hypothetical protein